jgi:hypothetical protein
MCKYHVDSHAIRSVRATDSRLFHALPILPLAFSHHVHFHHPISVLSPLLRSVVRSSISAIANKLESANHLADGEETQALGRNNTTSYHLLGVDVPDLLEYASG